jgi:alpha-tubulin suppressor-like RCC1 family protein
VLINLLITFSTGQLGNGGLKSAQIYPTLVSLSSLPVGNNISSIATSYLASYIILSTGVVYSFGDNGHGQLGVGSSASLGYSATPVAMKMSGALSGKKVKFIADSYMSVLLLTTDGVAYSFGYYQYV